MADSLYEIGIRLQQERKRMGLSQSDFSKILGVSRATQAAYESGRNAADVTYIANAYNQGIDVEYVILGVRAKAIAGNNLDWGLIASLTEAMQAVQSNLGCVLDLAKKGQVLKVLYRLSANEAAPGRINMDLVREITQLASKGGVQG